MATKKKGIVARPGKYTFGDVTEIKTAEELKKAVERQPIITLTLGHPDGGTVRASDYLGTVTQRWNEEKQRVDGDFWFYDEYLPEHMREKIINDLPVSISAGYTVDSIEDGVQKGILYSHVALLDGENPKCPLQECGVNVRMESNSPMRYEQESSLSDPPEPKPELQEKEEPKAEAPSLGFNEAQLAQLRDLISELVPAPPASKEPEVESVEEPEPAPVPPPEEPKVEPEKVVPAERPDSGKRLEPRTEGVQFLGEEKK
jgi:hypothetical protein